MSEICSVEAAIGVALVELLLEMLAGADMARRLSVAEAVLMAACEIGASAETCGALLEAINGGEVERITVLTARVGGGLRGTHPAASHVPAPH